jgi:hypothetical protein
LKFNTTNKLIITKTKKETTKKSTLETIVIRGSKKYLKRNLSVTDFRHMYVENTVYNNPDMTLLERKKIAKAMGHSIQMNEIYRRFKN